MSADFSNFEMDDDVEPKAKMPKVAKVIVVERFSPHPTYLYSYCLNTK